ncbi:hypothetical protein BJV82DRAFT_593680 [Fennellomyces sp. T-0311]|nr:hypothetical protein BJV82DRAFT_593672 [Fennellomyces sp. T-0311]KAI8147863.1 hypothetical protein BJV82DRAFT_593680 [Fennellomyces sp. T-0311]
MIYCLVLVVTLLASTLLVRKSGTLGDSFALFPIIEHLMVRFLANTLLEHICGTLGDSLALFAYHTPSYRLRKLLNDALSLVV